MKVAPLSECHSGLDSVVWDVGMCDLDLCWVYKVNIHFTQETHPHTDEPRVLIHPNVGWASHLVQKYHLSFGRTEGQM